MYKYTYVLLDILTIAFNIFFSLKYWSRIIFKIYQEYMVMQICRESKQNDPICKIVPSTELHFKIQLM